MTVSLGTQERLETYFQGVNQKLSKEKLAKAPAEHILHMSSPGLSLVKQQGESVPQ